MKNIAISILILSCLVNFSLAEDTAKMTDSSYFGNDIGWTQHTTEYNNLLTNLSTQDAFYGYVMATTNLKYSSEYSTSISPDARAKALQAYGRMPLSFVENKGQMDSTVRFYVSGAAMTMFFTNTEMVMEIIKRDNSAEKPDRRHAMPGMDKSTTAVKEERLVLRRQFLNTASTSQLFGTKALPGKVNILRGNDSSKWKQNITTYSEIEYQYLYPGIDVYYNGTNSNLDTKIQINPKANAKLIEFAFQGADRVKLTKTGDLEIDTHFGPLMEQKPGAYQEINGKKVLVPIKFVLKKKNTVGFEIGKYDPSLPLIID